MKTAGEEVPEVKHKANLSCTDTPSLYKTVVLLLNTRSTCRRTVFIICYSPGALSRCSTTKHCSCSWMFYRWQTPPPSSLCPHPRGLENPHTHILKHTHTLELPLFLETPVPRKRRPLVKYPSSGLKGLCSDIHCPQWMNSNSSDPLIVSGAATSDEVKDSAPDPVTTKQHANKLEEFVFIVWTPASVTGFPSWSINQSINQSVGL